MRRTDPDAAGLLTATLGEPFSFWSFKWISVRLKGHSVTWTLREVFCDSLRIAGYSHLDNQASDRSL